MYRIFSKYLFMYLWNRILDMEFGSKQKTSYRFGKYCNCSPFQFSSVAQSCPPLCNSIDCSTPGFPIHRQLLELAQIHVHWVSDAIQPSHPPSSPSPSAFTLSQNQGLFQWDSSSHHMPEYGSFSFRICPSNEYSGLIFLRINWLDLLAVQGTLKSLLNTTIQKHQFSVLSFLYGPTLTSIHVYWKNNSFE